MIVTEVLDRNMGHHFSGDKRAPLTILWYPLLLERQVRGRWLVDSLSDKGTFQTTSYQAIKLPNATMPFR